MRSFVLGAGLVMLPLLASAEPTRFRTAIDARIEDPAGKLTLAALTGTVRTADGTRLDACWTRPGTLTAKIVFDGSRVAALEVSGGADRDVEECVARVLRGISLPDGAGRAAATIQLTGAVRPPPMALIESKNRKLLEEILARDAVNLGKLSSAPPNEIGIGVGGVLSGGSGGGGGGSVRVGTGGGGGGPGTGVGSARGAPTPADAGSPRNVPQPPPEAKVNGRQPPEGALNDRTAAEIQRVLLARLGLVRACYQRALTQTPGLAGKIVVRFTIRPDGTVVSARVDAAKTTLTSQPLHTCVERVIASLQFPAKDTKSEVSYPLVFSPGT